MAGTLLGLYMLHRKGRQERRIKLEQYETEQMAYRQSLASLSHAHQSLMALPKNTVSHALSCALNAADPRSLAGGRRPTIAVLARRRD